MLKAWGFHYKSNIVWHKIRKDGGPDGRGVGFYFRNTTELVLFGVRGKDIRTLAPGRRQVNIIKTMKREHSRKPDELFDMVEACSPGAAPGNVRPRRRARVVHWGDQAEEYAPSWPTYANHSAAEAVTGNEVIRQQRGRTKGRAPSRVAHRAARRRNRWLTNRSQEMADEEDSSCRPSASPQPCFRSTAARP